VLHAEFKAWKRGVVTLVNPQIEKNCSKLLAGDEKEREKVKKALEGWKSQLNYSELLNNTKNCSWLVDDFIGNLYNSKLEKSFPIAFIFVVYDGPEQFMRLLKLLYRPQNVYCIHPDVKSKFKEFYANFAKCFSNIIMPLHSVDVRWGSSSILSAQMNCLSDLVHYNSAQVVGQRWKYAINLCGKELPLVSSREMVKRLIRLNGASSVLARAVPANAAYTRSRLKKKPIPYDLKFYKSSSYNALSLSFVHFILTNFTARTVYRFFLHVNNPEEHFYSTVYMIPGIPGGYNPLLSQGSYIEVAHAFWRITKRGLFF